MSPTQSRRFRAASNAFFAVLSAVAVLAGLVAVYELHRLHLAW